MGCAICEGPVPNALNEGEYCGATTRFGNGKELCSRCGELEALVPYFDIACRKQMEAAQEQNNWDAWVECILAYVPNYQLLDVNPMGGE